MSASASYLRRCDLPTHFADSGISFAALQRHSPLLQKLKESEHDAIRSLRNFGRGDLEVELALSTPSAPERSLYHVRRKDWATLSELNIRAMTDGHWDDCTLYVVSVVFHVVLAISTDRPLGARKISRHNTGELLET